MKKRETPMEAQTIKQILSTVDHTCLMPGTTHADISNLCKEAQQYHTAAVCVPPAWVHTARGILGASMSVCTVIGFPNGYQTTAVKVMETADAVSNGADEIDMVINIGWVHDGMDEAVRREICAVRAACESQVLKVIVECCLLSEEEIKRMCQVVGNTGADFIKTSTGFSHGGATRENVALLRRYTAPQIQIKAAGGITSLQDAADFLALGATRLGTSRIVKLVKEQFGTMVF